jgi:regulator of RNase E activity RraA
MDDLSVACVLRWAALERGTAGLSDEFGAELVVPGTPTLFVPGDCALAGRVVTLRRQHSAETRSSFTTLFEVVRAGCIVLVDTGRQAGAAFGSNLALAASMAGAQALITTGVARDGTRIAQLGFPVGCAGWGPRRPAAGPMTPADEVRMFGVTWRPGDWLLRDNDGIVRLDHAAASSIAAKVAADADREVGSLVAGASAGARAAGGM